MTKNQAIQDAKDRAEKTGLIWYAIKIRLGMFKSVYDTVSEHHEITHKDLYKSGHFKKVYICEPEVVKELETELDYINLDTDHNYPRKYLNKIKI